MHFILICFAFSNSEARAGRSAGSANNTGRGLWRPADHTGRTRRAGRPIQGGEHTGPADRRTHTGRGTYRTGGQAGPANHMGRADQAGRPSPDMRTARNTADSTADPRRPGQQKNRPAPRTCITIGHDVSHIAPHIQLHIIADGISQFLKDSVLLFDLVLKLRQLFERQGREQHIHDQGLYDYGRLACQTAVIFDRCH